MKCRAVALLAAIASAWCAAAIDLSAQSPTFEVVSIRRTDPTQGVKGSSFDQRPDGGITAINVLVTNLITRAYSLPIADAPEWARSERYDVQTRSSLQSPTQADRASMLRSMLADRFKLAVRVEPREQDAYVLTLARSDARLGPGLTAVTTQCPANPAEASAPSAPGPAPRPDLTAPPPPCTMRIVGANPLLVDLGQAPTGDVLEGEATMTELVLMLRTTTGRIVVDETGLKGTYRVAMKFDMAATRLGPALMPGRETGVPNVFAAIQQQLGLKLESTRVPTDTLVIERLERPTEN